jgi:putative membrane protein
MLHIGDGFGWWMLWGTLMMVVFWGGIVALVVWAVHSLSRGGTRSSQGRDADASPTPLDIAKQRYARGEIDREEFERMRRDLA